MLYTNIFRWEKSSGSISGMGCMMSTLMDMWKHLNATCSATMKLHKYPLFAMTHILEVQRKKRWFCQYQKPVLNFHFPSILVNQFPFLNEITAHLVLSMPDWCQREWWLNLRQLEKSHPDHG